jgi:hypothetical protein
MKLSILNEQMGEGEPAREKLAEKNKPGDFVYAPSKEHPQGKYPIQSRKQAGTAVSLAAMHADDDKGRKELEDVVTACHKKYSDMPSWEEHKKEHNL